MNNSEAFNESDYFQSTAETSRSERLGTAMEEPLEQAWGAGIRTPDYRYGRSRAAHGIENAGEREGTPQAHQRRIRARVQRTLSRWSGGDGLRIGTFQSDT